MFFCLREKCVSEATIVRPEQIVAADPLFRPFVLKDLLLANRIVMSPMTRSFSPSGIPGDNVAAYYRRRVEGGVGLVITEGTYIAHRSSGDGSHIPRLESEATVAALRKVTDAVHKAGGRIFAQLWHMGQLGLPGKQIDPSVRLLGPSGLNGTGEGVDAPMSIAEIDSVIEAFGHSAAAAQRAGFDGIEIHAGHGYLLDQFFWQRSNKRTDRYGGGIAERTRFAVEVVRECRRRVGGGLPISLRWSQWKIQDFAAKLASSPDELTSFLEPLATSGVDIFHCSQRRFWDPEFPGSPLNLAGWTRKITGKPTITVGSVTLTSDTDGNPHDGAAQHVAMLAERLERAEFDLVAVGRAMIANPAWPRLVRRGDYHDLAAFVRPEIRDTLY
jgi:2,4-dienoyl-CoA reductase-like NADH-dependent reductase (Old Yellow Enzyme family)